MEYARSIYTNAPKGGVKIDRLPVVKLPEHNVKLRVLYNGLCGTDRGITSGGLSFAFNPENSDRLIIGHESLCVIEEIYTESKEFKVGDLVVPVVRRPGDCVNCKIGRQDNCSDGKKHEAGITGMDGFMREYFYDSLDYIVKVPDEGMRDVAVLTEPLKNVVKGFEVFTIVSKRAIFANQYSTFEGKRCLVIGSGAEAFLYSMMAKEYGFDVIMTNRHPIESKKMEICGKFGITFIDYTKEIEKITKPGNDLLIDTSGDPGTIFRFLKTLNYNGILILFGTNGKAPPAQLNGNDIDFFIERNITVAGSVDAAKIHYIKALEYLRKWKYIYGDTLPGLITGTFSPDDLDIFSKKPAGEIKTVIKW
ncbi:MAG: glucose dehydrogenase [Thermoplasmatales archaeon B_DKE]|nr:MAG: glucose dehydrogenase [Thermoplasmatales archaeon B_DKE]QRF76294.1 Glucose 1-dehydrogenase 2 [Thermoplasmatales archaeon]